MRWRAPAFPSLDGPRVHAALVASVVALAAALALWNLGGRLLWEDEAETALLARRILDVGLPIARDGQQVISQGCGLDADENYLWTFHPWLPMYLVAAAFTVLGPTTAAARLPFALAGVLCVLSVYLAGRRLFRDPGVALLAAASLALSVPFLLHVRQSRYYALAALGAVWMLALARETAAGRRGAAVGFVVASTVMLHANHAMFAATFLALAAAHVVFERDPGGLGRLMLAGATAIAVNLPWLLIYGGAWVGAAFSESDRTLGATVTTFGSGLVWYAEHVDLYALPLALLVIFAIWTTVEARHTVPTTTGFRTAATILVVAVVYLGGVSLLPYSSTRFMVNVMPAFALVQAYVIRTLGDRRPWIAALLFVLVTGTNALHGWLERATGKTPPGTDPPTLVNYVRELRSDFPGANWGLVTYLRANAAPGERVFISYGDLPLRFYTDLDVRGGVTCEPPPATLPDWIVSRHFFRFRHPAPGTEQDRERMARWLQTVPWRAYERIELPVVDTVWENNPEPRWHHFRAPRTGRRVVVYRLIDRGDRP